MNILGILNITTDSFSDGGRYLEPSAALAQAHKLAADGAAILDIGAASSHPAAKAVAPEIEIARLDAVVPALKARAIPLSIDTFAPQVQRWALGQGVDYLNDIHGFPDAALYPELAASSCGLIVMHAVQPSGVAVRTEIPPSEIWDRILRFFDIRLDALTRAGIARTRIILDPGMGQFLGSDVENSLIVLRRLPELKARYGLPILVSLSRKGFLRKLTGQPIAAIGPASLAAELFAEANGADFIRTHDPAALRDGLKVLKAIGKDAGPGSP
ncbi:MAG: dihydropteroate synthase [Alphaproteobacteria bacterium 64-11]|nr:dihydropteroate synthase [Alphaproteobacteria bacterium]OJU07522.1 MAG: dihydropteroate synthase [Alphaproteobacteria bacterium 64-11]